MKKTLLILITVLAFFSKSAQSQNHQYSIQPLGAEKYAQIFHLVKDTNLFPKFYPVLFNGEHFCSLKHDNTTIIVDFPDLMGDTIQINGNTLEVKWNTDGAFKGKDTAQAKTLISTLVNLCLVSRITDFQGIIYEALNEKGQLNTGSQSYTYRDKKLSFVYDKNEGFLVLLVNGKFVDGDQELFSIWLSFILNKYGLIRG